MKTPRTLVTIASRQVWPQILATLHIAPRRLVLLHSGDERESAQPAKRLRTFFAKTGILAPGDMRLAEMPHDDFDGVTAALDGLQTPLDAPLSECLLNVTGGNKLMAAGAIRWALRHGVPAFYLERDNNLTWFGTGDDTARAKREQLDGHLADGFDPCDLLRCQMDASEIERDGERLTLNNAGATVPEAEFRRRIESGFDPVAWLDTAGEADREAKQGDALERAAAALLLKLGVRQVRRSLRLKVRARPGVGTHRPHAEIDLLFTWNGRLWLVDCKDRRPAEDLVAALRRELRNANAPYVQAADTLLERIESELTVGRTKTLKEDLVASLEIGGLLAQVVCVRREQMPEEALEYARGNHIDVVQKADLWQGFRRLLHPAAPPTEEDLRALQDALGAGS